MIRHVVLVGALVACHPQPPPPTLGHLNLVPAEAGFALGFEIAMLKQTRLWSAVGGKLVAMAIGGDEQRTLDRLKSRCDIDPVRDIRWLVLVATDSERALDRGVLLVNGAWDRNKIERCAATYRQPAATHRRSRDAAELGLFAQQAPAVAEDPPVEATGPFTKYGDFWLGWVAADTIAVAFERAALPLLGRVIDNAHRGGALPNPALATMLKRVDPSAVLWFAGALGDGRLRALDPFDSDVLKHASATVFSVALANDLQLHFAAVEPQRDATDQLAKHLDERLHHKLDGVPFLDRLKITTAGLEIHADAQLDGPTLDTITALISNAADRLLAERKREAEVPDVTPPPPPPPPADRDGDGIPDYLDKCPVDPEDKDGFQDADGCPDPDNDGDGIPDVSDKCPNQAGPPPDGCPLTPEQKEQIRRDTERRASSRTAQAMEYLKAGVFDKALEEFQAAYHLVPVPLLLFDIALTYDQMKDPRNALDYYKRYVDGDPDGVKAKDARKRIAEITKALERKH